MARETGSPVRETLRGLAVVLISTTLLGCVRPTTAATSVPATATATAALPSWTEGPTKAAITSFVTRVTTAGSPDFVPVSKRIAVFDNDGTLLCEQPMYVQVQFLLDRVIAVAPQHPEWKTTPPFSYALAGDTKGFLSGGPGSSIAVMTALKTDMTTDDFQEIARDWFRTARHPKTGKPYTEMVYQPMLEVLDYLRANGFKTYIVTGSGVEFVRAFAESTYGIPPEQVIGSQGKLDYQVRDGKPVLLKLPDVQFINDGPGKAAGIATFIGRRPIAAFGNSDGDRQMLEWTMAGPGPHIALLVHHTDAVREAAYDRDSPIGKLDKALDEAKTAGWTIIDMKSDWKRVYKFQ